ncbi:MAG TPA: ABC transporter permease [Planctomycetota bacterium]|nr:ABC transporter permease [Planctomycetota bacterium]
MSWIEHALGSSLRIGTPLLFAGLGELVLERSGMINIGIEGVMLCGAFGGFYAGWAAQSPLIGALAGALSGAAFMLVFAFMSLKLRAEQIVTGMAMNLIAAGATSTAFDALRAAHSGESLSVPVLGGLFPQWSSLPVVGPIVFDQTVLTSFALISVVAVWFYFARTERGLELRAVGENPDAAQAAGVSVVAARVKACLACGALCGLGGAFLTVSQTSSFAPNCTSGRGFVALAAVVLGRHGAFGTAAACFFFGAAFFSRDAIPTTSAAVELVEILPYALTLAALCWKFKSRPAPAALGKVW